MIVLGEGLGGERLERRFSLRADAAGVVVHDVPCNPVNEGGEPLRLTHLPPAHGLQHGNQRVLREVARDVVVPRPGQHDRPHAWEKVKDERGFRLGCPVAMRVTSAESAADSPASVTGTL